MTAVKYTSDIKYGGTICSGPIYGVETDASGQIGGNITDVQEWIGHVVLTDNVIIQNGSAVVIGCNTTIEPDGYTIVVQDGGYLNTRGNRLPDGSAIGSIIIIS